MTAAYLERSKPTENGERIKSTGTGRGWTVAGAKSLKMRNLRKRKTKVGER